MPVSAAPTGVPKGGAMSSPEWKWSVGQLGSYGSARKSVQPNSWVIGPRSGYAK